MNTCQDCGTELPTRKPGPGRPRKRCEGCKPPRPKTKTGQRPSGALTCADCGNPMWRGRTSLPQGEARCLPCRRARPVVKRTYKPGTPCVDCGTPSSGQRCRPCAKKAKAYSRPLIRSLDDHRVERRLREQSAPGLGPYQRTKLLHRWLRERRSCAYCHERPATTVDHVVPLVRGGTNHEGNLAPACRPCNGSKGGLTLVEWRTGKRLPPMTTPLPWVIVRSAKRPEPKPKPKVVARPCGTCAGVMVTAPYAYCSDACRVERNRRLQRDIYRARVGLSVDPDLPTSKWRQPAKALPLPLGLVG